MIRKRSHSNTNVSKKEKPPQQESGMAHPSPARWAIPCCCRKSWWKGAGDEDGGSLKMLLIARIDCPCPSSLLAIAAQKWEYVHQDGKGYLWYCYSFGTPVRGG